MSRFLLKFVIMPKSAPKKASTNHTSSKRPVNKGTAASKNQTAKRKNLSKGKAPANTADNESLSLGLHVKTLTMTELHARNDHIGRYDFAKLVEALPELAPFTFANPHGDTSINFSDDESVKMLNKALLALHYGVKQWDIPTGYLCPPIPGRVDYIHHIGDLLAQCNKGKLPVGVKVTGLDIGAGANAIYPIVASSCYKWGMVGSDIDPISVENAKNIAQNNAHLAQKLQFRLQENNKNFFANIIKDGEFYDFTMCNPPFHASQEEANKGSQRKLQNLAINREKRGQKPEPKKQSALNFGGQNAELWCKGGEETFIRNMAFESADFKNQCLWFTTLISKKENVRQLTRALDKVGVTNIQVVEMKHGQKITRFVAWSFLTPEQQQLWASAKWK
ncbi:23S rRNA (adenine(1618)-N(6))-methyltransferase RlmF [Vibrio tapetis subsp. quintayensis]|uniref:23S rRNA (adenine(1618)-N(6))-methyltransferase RlmF n=1 Tax=Vibrio tapetis TaxID=52443 RepID=UPI0025B5C2B9|nr:23S rRNA (adenine(1618)-N(6))-methyltransferase RlmF [Vibrio tapetis]MDN3679252.1 23S rRNA (adenine(1618)-N(6))-methyltransferase RlmF [Vibrio tapetis subsp. quintayensis]